MTTTTHFPEPVRWASEGESASAGTGPAVDLLDQTRLPEVEVRLRLDSAESVAEAIRVLRVRGAPAIGIAGAMGLAIEAVRHASLDRAAFDRKLDEVRAQLASTRPTGVNLRWALDRMMAIARRDAEASPTELAERLRDEATAILEEDRAMCARIGEHGLALVPEGARILTHCNAGSLATGGGGTALAPIYAAAARGQDIQVFATETRPLLQGSRLTAWELARADVAVTVLIDSAAGSLMRTGAVDLVLVGADRVAANGDVANKIGTYTMAVLAAKHGVPFYVAVPWSTVDALTLDGASIEIEQRDPDEVRRGFGRLTAPEDVPIYSPAFDVTPADLVHAIITDRGVLRPPFTEAIAAAG